MLSNLFFKFDDYKLERFQIENLSTSIVPFTFFSLDPLPELSELLIRSVQYVEAPIDELERKVVNKETPVVFVCKNGKKSKKIVKKAVDLGFKNVYFIESGFKTLVK